MVGLEATQFFKESVKQVPSLVVLAAIVYMTLTALEKQAIAFTQVLEKRDAHLEVIGNGCHEVQRDAVQAIRDNTKALGAHSVALDNFTDVMRDVEDVLTRIKEKNN